MTSVQTGGEGHVGIRRNRETKETERKRKKKSRIKTTDTQMAQRPRPSTGPRSTEDLQSQRCVQPSKGKCTADPGTS